MQGKLKLIIPPEEIHIAVDRLATAIRADYSGRTPVVIGVLKGAFMFTSDLVRALKIPFELDFIQTSCYAGNVTPCPEVSIVKDVSIELRERNVIIVEDIVDRGETATAIIAHIKRFQPATVEVCALLKRAGTRASDNIKYTGMEVKAGYVVGYGMDYNEHFRGLPGLYVLDK